MILARTFQLAGLLAFLAAPVADALATPVRLDRGDEAVTVAEAAVRKGTRAYRPEGPAAATTDVPAEPTPSASAKDKLDQCLDTWDAGTHITKSKWREICQRQLKSDE
jgi:hypothetical protein